MEKQQETGNFTPVSRISNGIFRKQEQKRAGKVYLCVHEAVPTPTDPAAGRECPVYRRGGDRAVSPDALGEAAGP
ncbi:MAG: hypothetical protein IJQ93_11905, partial [Bacteroidales bacterium]|nr:hypothetical protein [Bacteroidales bacterium]